MLLRIALGCAVAYVVYQLAGTIYNIYFHPLSKFPGPKLWIAFPVLRQLAQCRGTFDKQMVRLHERYGEVVRVNDRTVSFTTAQASKDIYGYGHGQTQWPKQDFRPPGAIPEIVFSNDADHARFRRALAHAFSEQALRLQEGVVRMYVDMLIDRLRDEVGNGQDVDMTMWYNLTTFDIISDLAFGEPSNCLKNQGYTESIIIIFKFLKIVPYVQLMTFYPLIWRLVKLAIGKKVDSARKNHQENCLAVAMKRKNDRSKDGRGDFMEAMLNHSEHKAVISDDELAANAHVLFLAGSETTATLLAGVTYWMLRTPEAYARAIKEVRDAFEKEEDITFSTASARIPYTLACLEEGLRMYPPLPTILARITPEVVTVDGHVLPAGTVVGTHQLATNWSTSNFAKPGTFAPERWLPDATTNPTSPFFQDNRDARQPFSQGPRNCIGKNLAFSEMRQILARVLWNFDLELVDKDQNWADQKAFVLWDKGPLMCHIRARKDQ